VLPTLSAINRYPVKSFRGESLTEAVLEPWGLAGDRRWMVVDADGKAITAREVNSMLLVRPRLVDDGLVLAATGQPELSVPRPTTEPVAVSVHGKPLMAVPAPRTDAWLGDVLGRPARLVYLADPTGRPTNPAFSRADDRVGFADAYPVLVATEGSLGALNGWIGDGPNAEVAPLPMTRFRPNLVIAATDAWAEDGWRRLRIGAAEFRAVKGCDRCVMTTVDPSSAGRGKEPLATLARHRRWDGATWFGMNLIPDTPDVTIRVGDPVEILAAVPAPDGPPR
jgi:uncharacterized protein YcbX